MAEIKWISVNEKLPEQYCDVLVGIQHDEEQRLDILFAYLDEHNEWVFPYEDLYSTLCDRGYAEVIAWADLGDFVDALDDFILHGARKLQTV